MSDQETPETDLVTIPWYGNTEVVRADFARALERERDEARELARELRDALEDCREDSVELLGEWDWKRGGGTRNSAQYEELEGRVSLADSVIDKAKEVLG